MMKRVVTGLATLTPLARGHSAPYSYFAASHILASLRGGSDGSSPATTNTTNTSTGPGPGRGPGPSVTPARSFSSNTAGPGGPGGGGEASSSSLSSSSSSPPEYTSLAEPAPGSPFHWAFPVHNLQAAKEFYGNVLGCQEGRSSVKWQDYSYVPSRIQYINVSVLVLALALVLLDT
jgi:hypothetical protein